MPKSDSGQEKAMQADKIEESQPAMGNSETVEDDFVASGPDIPVPEDAFRRWKESTVQSEFQEPSTIQEEAQDGFSQPMAQGRPGEIWQEGQMGQATQQPPYEQTGFSVSQQGSADAPTAFQGYMQPQAMQPNAQAFQPFGQTPFARSQDAIQASGNATDATSLPPVDAVESTDGPAEAAAEGAANAAVETEPANDPPVSVPAQPSAVPAASSPAITSPQPPAVPQIPDNVKTGKASAEPEEGSDLAQDVGNANPAAPSAQPNLQEETPQSSDSFDLPVSSSQLKRVDFESGEQPDQEGVQGAYDPSLGQASPYDVYQYQGYTATYQQPQDGSWSQYQGWQPQVPSGDVADQEAASYPQGVQEEPYPGYQQDQMISQYAAASAIEPMQLMQQPFQSPQSPNVQNVYNGNQETGQASEYPYPYTQGYYPQELPDYQQQPYAADQGGQYYYQQFPTQGYPDPGYANQGYPQNGYEGQNYGQNAYGYQDYGQQAYGQPVYDQQQYDPQAYSQQAYGQQPQIQQQAYPENNGQGYDFGQQGYIHEQAMQGNMAASGMQQPPFGQDGPLGQIEVQQDAEALNRGENDQLGLTLQQETDISQSPDVLTSQTYGLQETIQHPDDVADATSFADVTPDDTQQDFDAQVIIQQDYPVMEDPSAAQALDSLQAPPQISSEIPQLAQMQQLGQDQVASEYAAAVAAGMVQPGIGATGSFSDYASAPSPNSGRRGPGGPGQIQSAKGGGAHGAPRKKKMSGLKKAFLIIGGALLGIIAICAVGIGMYLGSINSNLQEGIDEEVMGALVEPESENEPFYTLILGSDTREVGGAGRSDTIILARIDPETKDVSLVSIPRDTQVQLEGHGTQKINAAYAFGGTSGAIKAVSELAGVPITHVVEVDFSGFKEIVDALGGVTVNVPKNTHYQGVYIPEGKQTLDGDQALVFVRCRKGYASGDYQRADNQRQLIGAVVKKTLNSSVVEMTNLINSITEAISTDMSVTDILALANMMRGFNTDDMITCVMPSHPGSQGGVSYVFVEEPAWSEMMEIINAGGDPNEDSSSKSSKSSSSSGSGSNSNGTVVEILEED